MKSTMPARLLLAAVLSSTSLAAFAGTVFSSANYNATTQFANVLGNTTMTVAFDGNSYWSTSGGGTDGIRLAQYDATGNVLGSYAPGLDFRSVFTDASNTVLARQYASNTIYQQTAPGVFASLLNLNGGALDEQSAVVKDGSNYVAYMNGAVSQWSAAGSYIGTVNLTGLAGAETYYPQGRGMAVAGDYWLTYNNGTLSAWDHSGNRVDSTTLNGVTNAFGTNFSLSYANHQVFLVDSSNTVWRGYDVGVTAVPEPETYAMMLGGLFALGLVARRRKTAANAA